MSVSTEDPRNGAPDSEFRWFEIEVSDILFLIRKHWLLIFVVPLAGAFLAFGATRLMKPQFSSTSLIYLKPDFDKSIVLEKRFSQGEDEDSLRSIERALISDTVILRVVDRLGLRGNLDYLGEVTSEGELTDDGLLKKVRKRYQTRLIPNTRLIELEVRDFDPQRSQKLANTTLEEFLNHLAEDRNKKEAELRETLTVQAENALSESLKAEKKLEEFRTRHPDTIVEQDSSIFQERLLQYGNALNQAASEKADLEGMVAALEPIDPETDPYRIFQILKNRNSDYLSELLAMHASAKAELATADQRYTREHPNYRAASSRLEQVETTLRSYAAEMKDGLQSEFDAFTRKESELRDSMKSLQGDFVGYKSKSAEFRGLKEEIDRSWNTYTQLQEKITDLDLKLDTDLNFVTLMSKPVVPDNKSYPVTKFWMAGGGVLGCMIVLGLLFFRYRNGLPYTSLNQINWPNRTEVKEPNASTVADDPAILDLAISLGKYPIVQVGDPLSESFGTELPTSLAELFARQGIKTLLVKIQFAAIAGDRNPRRSRMQNLSLLTVPSSWLLNTKEYRGFLYRTLEEYDRLVIDTTSVSEWATMMSVATEADANVIVVHRNGGSRSSYQDFFERFPGSSAESFVVMLDGKVAISKGPERIEEPRQNESASLNPFESGAQPTPFT